MQFLIVEWRDAICENAWTEARELCEAPLIVSAGWLVKEDDVSLSLAGSFSVQEDDRQLTQVMTVPKGMVVKERAVKALEL